MKFTANGYEIDIKARRVGDGENNFNYQDTRSILIDLACYLADASEYHDEYGRHALSKDASAYGHAFREAYQKCDRDMAILDSVDAGRKA